MNAVFLISTLTILSTSSVAFDMADCCRHAALAVEQADTTSFSTLLGVAKTIMGYMSTKAETAEDSLAVKMLEQTIGAVEAGDRDGVFAPLKDYATGALAEANGLPGSIAEVVVGVVETLPPGTDTSVISRMNPQTFFLNIPAANYSGIAPVSIFGLEGDFVLVDDKSETEGFRRVHLTFDGNGQITAARDDGFVAVSSGAAGTDGEGIVYDGRRGTVLLAREVSNEVLEFGLDGKATGRYLHTASFYPANGNAGLESLAWNDATGRFWTATEDIPPGKDAIRFQSYAPYFWPLGHWFYRPDKPEVKNKGAIYAHGVSELCALDDGRLLVLEREANIPGTSVSQAAGAGVSCKLYMVDPSSAKRGTILEKHLVTRFDTYALDLSFANYEGMCLGPILPDGGRVLILVSDSQAGYKGVLRDWFKTIILK